MYQGAEYFSYPFVNYELPIRFRLFFILKYDL